MRQTTGYLSLRSPSDIATGGDNSPSEFTFLARFLKINVLCCLLVKEMIHDRES